MILVLSSASPAAANETAGGFVDELGDPTAVAGDDGAGPPTERGEDRDCRWRVIVGDDRRYPVFDAAGRRVFSETGRWLQMICNDSLVYVDGWPLVPERGRVDVQALVAEAQRSVRIDGPIIETSPDFTRSLFVQVPTWLWVDPQWWRPYEATASAGRVSATVSARPTRSVWSMGDGTTVACAGAGVPWREGASDAETSCRHTYRRSSASQGGGAYEVRVQVEMEVTWSSNVGLSGRLPAVSRSSSVLARVAEIQAIGSKGE